MSSGSDLKVLHVITSLFAGGGAETLLVRLLEELGDEQPNHSVLSLRRRGTLAPRVEKLGLTVEAIGMGGRPRPSDVMRLRTALKKSDADVIQTWMLHSNVLAGLVGRISTGHPIVWGVHVGEITRATLGTKAVVVQRAEALTSRFVPARIVACSFTSRDVMHRLHYERHRILTIPNGFDVGLYEPDPEARRAVRDELGISDGETVVGHVARFHPAKDHPTLFRAARTVLDKNPSVRFVLCGDGVDPSNEKLAALAAPLGDRVHLLGQRDDIPRMLNGFDLGVSSSASEALPLAIGEAMATELPVAATNCGDSADMVGDTGEISPIGDPDALAASLLRLVDLGPAGRKELGAKARARVTENYSMARMVERYREVWQEAAHERDAERI